MDVCFFPRYWLFSEVVPGLYIEKGWVHESIDYSFTPPPEEKAAEPDVEEDEAKSVATDDSQGITCVKVVKCFDVKVMDSHG